MITGRILRMFRRRDPNEGKKKQAGETTPK